MGILQKAKELFDPAAQKAEKDALLAEAKAIVANDTELQEKAKATIIEASLSKSEEEEVVSVSAKDSFVSNLDTILAEEEPEPVEEGITPASISDQKEPDYVLELDVSTVKTLQIGYQAETIFLYEAPGDKLILEEYINGLSGSEYYAKLTANRFKTTIRYGRREEVNNNTYVILYLPKSFKAELLLSSQYGSIITNTDWAMERFVAETPQGGIVLKKITAPRIRLNSSVKPIEIEEAVGFVDIHSVSGHILANKVIGGAKLETSSAPIFACFESLNNVVEAQTLNADIELMLPKDCGMELDGISKRGEIECELEGLEVRVKPGNVKALTGMTGTKPFHKVKFSTINGNVCLHY